MKSRTIDPTEALVMLKEHQPNFDLMTAVEEDENEKWANEVRMLERRPLSEREDVDLGNGDTIAIRTAISVAESKRIGSLEKERKSLNPENDKVRLDEIAYEILEILTANPLLTRDWFAQNEDHFALTDALKISMSFYEKVVGRAGRKQAVENFRKNE